MLLNLKIKQKNKLKVDYNDDEEYVCNSDKESVGSAIYQTYHDSFDRTKHIEKKANFKD